MRLITINVVVRVKDDCRVRKWLPDVIAENLEYDAGEELEVFEVTDVEENV